MLTYHVSADLLERALDVLRDSLQSEVECICELVAVADDFEPVPESATAEEAKSATALLALVRDFEAVTSRPAEHTHSQWLDDLIDGTWFLTPEENPFRCDDPVNLQGSGPGPIEPRET
ncbi:hypothetical protein [Aliihoeflea sp. PC F10.4]